MKYIIFANGEPIIFSDTLSHKEVAGNHMVNSAGFCRIETYRNQWDDVRAKVSVWGRSDSLNVESCQEDAKEIERIWFGF